LFHQRRHNAFVDNIAEPIDPFILDVQASFPAPSVAFMPSDMLFDVAVTRLVAFHEYLPVSFLVDLLSEVILLSGLSLFDLYLQRGEIGKDCL
jgi:hypothetical protein